MARRPTPAPSWPSSRCMGMIPSSSLHPRGIPPSLTRRTHWARGTLLTVTMSEQAAISAEVWFAGQEAPCTLYVTPRMEAENLAVRALAQMASWLALALLAFSLLCAFGYSRYITRPIVRLNGIAGRMAELDFHWSCGETRRDEIGQLGRSLDAMARRLDTALRGAGGRQPVPPGRGGAGAGAGPAADGLLLRRLPRIEDPGHHPAGTAGRDAGGGGRLPGPGQVPAPLPPGDGADGGPGPGDAGHLPDGDGVRPGEAGAGGSVRPDGASAGAGPGSAGAAGPAAGVRPDAGARW